MATKVDEAAWAEATKQYYDQGGIGPADAPLAKQFIQEKYDQIQANFEQVRKFEGL